VQGAFEPFFRANIDTSIINIGHASLSIYKLVIVPADYIMDAASAKALRDYVSAGGTVLMTAFSAKADEHGQWFDTLLPGRLSDVFGLKTNAFYDVPVALKIQLDGNSIKTAVHHYEVLEPSTAKVVARFTNTADDSPAVTINKFGKGNAIYLATESNRSAIEPLMNYLCKIGGVQPGPKTPEGVFARVVDGRTLFVNTTGEEKRIPISSVKRGVLSNRVFEKAVVLGPMEADLIE
jgi:beta-galactosidase